MRRATVSILVFLLIACLFLVIGCGEKKATVETPEGEIEFTEDDDGMTIKTEEGETSFSSENLTEEDLGIPIYPGATMVDEEVSSYMDKDAEGNITSLVASLQTKDPVADVVAWYREQLSGEQDFSEIGGVDGMGMFSILSDGMRITLAIDEDVEDTGLTIIQVTSHLETDSGTQ